MKIQHLSDRVLKAQIELEEKNIKSGELSEEQQAKAEVYLHELLEEQKKRGLK